MRRMNGAILDAMRSSDWVTRSVRSRARRLRDAGQDLGRTDQELADASGMPVAQVRETLAGIARRPVSFDPALHDVEDLASAEGSVMMGSVLQAAVAAMHALSSAGQVILVFHYYLQRSLGQIAEDLGLTADRAAELHNEGVVAVHAAMARAARDGA
jgi:RNA polymerase sigma factor for flagellar operon FliA